MTRSGTRPRCAAFIDLANHLREDVRKVEDAQAKALFETAAEVLIGLEKAFTDYEEGSEDAWQRQAR